MPIILNIMLVAIESQEHVAFFKYAFTFVLENVKRDIGPIEAKAVKNLFWTSLILSKNN